MVTEEVRVFGPTHGRTGPTHLQNNALYGLSWCGVKAQFRHWNRPGTVDEVTCPKCLRQHALSQPLAWRSR